MSTRLQSVTRASLVSLVAVLALIAAPASPVPAHAADRTVVDQEFVFPGTEGANLFTQGDRFAQPFVPTQPGVLASVTLTVWTVGEFEFSGASIHTMSPNDEVSPDPIAGGVGELSFAVWDDNPNVATATASFPGRPKLSDEQRYAIVVNPRPAAAPEHPGASFPMAFGGRPDYFVLSEQGGVWGAFWVTGGVYFSVRFASPEPQIEVTPMAPTIVPAERCSDRPSVQLPAQEGVTFARTGDADHVTVTATPHEGYVFPADAVQEWSFDLTLYPVCPVEPRVTSPVAPHFVSPSCDAPGSLSFTPTEGVNYVTSGPQNRTLVTAVILPEYETVSGTTLEWVYDLSQLKCDSPGGGGSPAPAAKTLADTGGRSHTNGLLLSGGLAGLGVLAVALARGLRGRATGR